MSLRCWGVNRIVFIPPPRRPHDSNHQGAPPRPSGNCRKYWTGETISRLPSRRLEMARRLLARVDSGSTIHVGGNAYSRPSRLIGEKVDVHVGAETLDVW